MDCRIIAFMVLAIVLGAVLIRCAIPGASKSRKGYCAYGAADQPVARNPNCSSVAGRESGVGDYPYAWFESCGYQKIGYSCKTTSKMEPGNPPVEIKHCDIVDNKCENVDNCEIYFEGVSQGCIEGLPDKLPCPLSPVVNGLLPVKNTWGCLGKPLVIMDIDGTIQDNCYMFVGGMPYSECKHTEECGIEGPYGKDGLSKSAIEVFTDILRLGFPVMCLSKHAENLKYLGVHITTDEDIAGQIRKTVAAAWASEQCNQIKTALNRWGQQVGIGDNLSSSGDSSVGGCPFYMGTYILGMTSGSKGDIVSNILQGLSFDLWTDSPTGVLQLFGTAYVPTVVTVFDDTQQNLQSVIDSCSGIPSTKIWQITSDPPLDQPALIDRGNPQQPNKIIFLGNPNKTTPGDDNECYKMSEYQRLVSHCCGISSPVASGVHNLVGSIRVLRNCLLSMVQAMGGQATQLDMDDGDKSLVEGCYGCQGLCQTSCYKPGETGKAWLGGPSNGRCLECCTAMTDPWEKDGLPGLYRYPLDGRCTGDSNTVTCLPYSSYPPGSYPTAPPA